MCDRYTGRVAKQIRNTPTALVKQRLWEFCECGGSDCGEFARLSLHSPTALHDGGQPVLAADGPSLIGRARLRREAEALCRQAIHGVVRARRNLSRRAP